MRRRFLVVPVLFLLIALPPVARADDFTIELKASTGKDSMAVDATYPGSAKQTRAVLAVGANNPITVKWTVRNVDKAIVKDALVHVFVVKIDKAGQTEVPKLTKDVIVQNALSTDFKAGDKSEAEITFSVANPGTYLLRVEIKKTAAKEEPFAALDIVVR